MFYVMMHITTDIVSLSVLYLKIKQFLPWNKSKMDITTVSQWIMASLTEKKTVLIHFCYCNVKLYPQGREGSGALSQYISHSSNRAFISFTI
mmetsp:Transcript_25955/g.34481  ORF Transcript_25955/g.34481 Transcript_25955/m.34481 type:complete len:92 (+) Transcript_25955:898-1173(+)